MRERSRGEREREGANESQAGSMLSAEPYAGFNPMTLGHDLSRNQESA